MHQFFFLARLHVIFLAVVKVIENHRSISEIIATGIFA